MYYYRQKAARSSEKREKTTFEVVLRGRKVKKVPITLQNSPEMRFLPSKSREIVM